MNINQNNNMLYIISNEKCELGEGAFLCERSKIFFWVDIKNSKIFGYCIKRAKIIYILDVSDNPSAILNVKNNKVIYVDRKSIKSIDLKTKETHLIHKINYHNPEISRANDGTILKNGDFVFGTMSDDSKNGPGKIYKANNIQIEYMEFGISIPNLFVEIEDELYIADSLEKKIYTINKNEMSIESLTLWKSFKNKKYTPDGGFVSEKGNLHICMWGGNKICVFNKYGVKLHEIVLPVLNPTNAAIYDNRLLFVTSASEGHTLEESKHYEISGHTLMIDLGDSYEY